jgi:hypothetical protein
MLLRRAMLVGNVEVKGALGGDEFRNLEIYNFYQLVFYIYFSCNNSAQVRNFRIWLETRDVSKMTCGRGAEIVSPSLSPPKDAGTRTRPTQSCF